MPAFKFKLAERVMVPGSEGVVQGLIGARSEYIGQPNTYMVAWLDTAMGLQNKVVTEDELIAAQPVPVEEQVAARVVAAVGKAEKTPLPPVPNFREMRGILKPRKRARSKRRAKR